MLRFVLVTASHTAIKRSKKLRSKYMSIVRRVGKNSAIVQVARILAELKHSMLKNCTEFVDRVDSLAERKMRAMSLRVKNVEAPDSVVQVVKLLRWSTYEIVRTSLFIGGSTL
ncbi:MAG: hypothetical protein QXU98_05430 [Candidatus Parvarchaeota archaeon]